jgi:hypothetical protein
MCSKPYDNYHRRRMYDGKNCTLEERCLYANYDCRTLLRVKELRNFNLMGAS